MMQRYATLFGLALLPWIGVAQMPGTGRVQIKLVRTYSGSGALTKPTSIVVYNFATTPERVELNKGVLNRVRTRVSGSEDKEKTELAQKIADNFSDSLIKDLQKTGLPVTKGVTGEESPENSLAVQGDFMTIDEGNRTRRMAVGLGVGASTVQVHVKCYFTQPAANALLTEFNATSQSSRKPGAAETMGAGAAPEVAATASGATEMKQSAEGDANRMAKAIAKEIDKTMKSQGWIEETR